MKKTILFCLITAYAATASAQTDATYQWAKSIGSVGSDYGYSAIPAMNGGDSMPYADSAEDRKGLSPSCYDLSQRKQHTLTPRFSGGQENDMETDNTNLIRQL